MSKPRQARLAFGRGECGQADVLRTFMEHPEWLAPAWLFGRTPNGRKVCFDGQHVVPEGELWVFTEAATANHASQCGTRLGTYVGSVPGTELFGALKHRAKALRINPGGYEEDELHLEPAMYDTLSEWASGVAIERGLPFVKDQPFTETMKTRLRAHERYHVPLFPDGRMISKPGYGGFEQPAVVCITPDSYEAFRQGVGAPLDAQMQHLTVDAASLSEQLERQHVDGVYINPMGPASLVLSVEAFGGDALIVEEQ